MVTASAPTLSSAQRGAMNADIRGRLEPETQTPEGFSGWRWIQCTEIQDEYRVLLPRHIAECYARLLEAEDKELQKSGSAGFDDAGIVLCLQIKDRLIRQCFKLSKFNSYSGSGLLTRNSVTAPPDFTLGKLERWDKRRERDGSAEALKHRSSRASKTDTESRPSTSPVPKAALVKTPAINRSAQASSPSTSAPAPLSPAPAQPVSPEPVPPKPASPKPASPKPAPIQPASPKKHAPAEPAPSKPASPKPASPKPATPKPASPQLASPRPAPLQPATGDKHLNYSAQEPASIADRSSSAASSNRSGSNRIIIYCPEDYRVERYDSRTWRSIDRIPVVPQVATDTKPVTPQDVLPAQKAATSPSISSHHRKAVAESKSRATSEVPASQTVPSGDSVIDGAAADCVVRPEAVSALNNNAMVTVDATKEPSLRSSPPAPPMLLISAPEPEAVLMAQKPSPPSLPRGSPTSLTMGGTGNDAAAHSDQSISSSARKVQQVAKETTMERSRAEPPSLTEGHSSGRNGDEREVIRPNIELMRPAATSARGGVSMAATPETTTRTWPGASTTPATAIPQGPQTSYGYGVGNGMSTGSLLDEKYLLRAPAMSNRPLVGEHSPGVVGTMDMKHAQYNYQRPRYQQMEKRDDKGSNKGWISKTISFTVDLATGKYRWKGPLLVKKTAHNPHIKVMPSTSAVEFVRGGYMQGRV